MKKFWELLLNDIIQDKSRLTESYNHQFNYDGRIKTAFEYLYSKLKIIERYPLNAIHDDRFYVPLDGCNFVLRKDWIAEPCIYMELTLKLKENRRITLKEVQSHFNRDLYSDNEFFTKDIDF